MSKKTLKMGTIGSEDDEFIDTKLALEIMELMQRRMQERNISLSDMIFVLLVILYEYARVKGVPPEEAIEDYKAMFLSIEGSPLQ
jgi:hypothetical protein